MIYYFSATGNSKYAALKLAHLTNDRAVNIADVFKKGLGDIPQNEVTGFVFPVYYSGLPKIVKRFVQLERIKASLGSYVYCVITCGGDNSAAADKMLSKALDCELDYSQSLKMPDNYVMLYNPCSRGRGFGLLKSADSALEDAAKEINARAGKPGSGFKDSVLTEIMYPFYSLLRRTSKFYADDKCTSCGRCVSLCPDGIISIHKGKPEWNAAKCQHCTACINGCPAQAIQFGKGTSERRRYNINEVIKFVQEGKYHDS